MAKTQDPAKIEQRLWRELSDGTTVMLGLTGGTPRHFQPMTVFSPGEGGPLFFYCRKDNALLRQAGDRAGAILCLMTRDHDFIASVGGELGERRGRDLIDEFWNPVVSAWFPEGKDDPNLTMLQFDATDAEVWVSHANPVRFAFDIAKARTMHSLPDVGERRHLEL